jgi:segregation and condensation protein B
MSTEKMDNTQIKSIIESLLFINERPIEMLELVGVLEVDKKDVLITLNELTLEYKTRNSGVCIVQVAGGYQMCSSPESEPWVKKMYQERNKQKLSTASLETLAIIAYKQPITRIEIEAIRGVSADSVVRKLTDLGLTKIGGRKDVIGKPFLYITTRKFLEYFGINSLKDLPNLEEFASLPTSGMNLQEQNEETNSSIASAPEAANDLKQKTEQPDIASVDSIEIEDSNLVKANDNDDSEFVKKETE